VALDQWIMETVHYEKVVDMKKLLKDLADDYRRRVWLFVEVPIYE
jgi:hypothetical protein